MSHYLFAQKIMKFKNPNQCCLYTFRITFSAQNVHLSPVQTSSWLYYSQFSVYNHHACSYSSPFMQLHQQLIQSKPHYPFQEIGRKLSSGC